VVTWSQEVFKSGTGFIGTRARTFVLNRGVSEIGIRFNVHFFIFHFFVAPLRRPIGQAETLPAGLESGERVAAVGAAARRACPPMGA